MWINYSKQIHVFNNLFLIVAMCLCPQWWSHRSQLSTMPSRRWGGQRRSKSEPSLLNRKSVREKTWMTTFHHIYLFHCCNIIFFYCWVELSTAEVWTLDHLCQGKIARDFPSGFFINWFHMGPNSYQIFSSDSITKFIQIFKEEHEWTASEKVCLTEWLVSS
jgi:hypothetical protein